MDNLFTLNIDDYIDPFYIGDEFNEFCNFLNILDEESSDYVTEAVVDKNSKLYKDKNDIIKNTASTIRDTVSVYGDITDANADLIKSSWDLMMKLIRMITRVTAFITHKIASIPTALSKSIDYISNLPISIKARISGNIQLYITAEDIEIIYNQMVIYKLDTFISTGSALSKGDLWGTMFRKEGGNKKEFASSNNDIKLCKKLEKLYADISSIQFVPNIIDLKDENNIKKYFSNEKVIDFKDLSGKEFQGTYFEALQKLNEDLSNKKDKLNEISKSMGDKYEKTQMNETFAKLNRFDQKRIVRVIRMISKTITIIGFMVKYTIHDVNTVNNKLTRLQKEIKKKKK